MATPQSASARNRSGALDILGDGVGVVRDNPLVVVPFLLLALVTLASTTLSNFLRIAVQAVVLVSAYSTLGGQTDTSNSMPVRILIAFIASLIAGIVIVIGFLLLVLPGIYASLRLRLVIAAVILDDAGPLEALSRSIELTAGNTTTVFGVWAVLTVASLLLGGIVLVVVGVPSGDPQAFQGVARLASAAATLLVAPVGVSANAVMFQEFS
jgi:hypothetical protein